MKHPDDLTDENGNQCSLCDQGLTKQEMREFYSMADDELHGEIYCRRCAERFLVVCRECSGRYTADDRGLCSTCVAREYSLVV
jgi:hypothetical protein